MNATNVSTLEKISQSNLKLADQKQDIRGMDVLDNTGQKIGRVDDLMIDSDEQKIRFMQLGSGGFLGIGREHFLMPVEAIDYIDHDAVHVTQSGAHVGSSPDYDPDLVLNHEYYGELYGYYGYPPYWDPNYKYPPFPPYRD